MRIDAETDEALVARAGRGDRTAAGQLILRHSDRVMGVCFRMLGDRAAAEDAAQETFLKLWRNAAKWRPQGAKFSTWLYRVAANTCLDRLRRSGREVQEDAAPEMADESPHAEERLMSADRAAAVNEAIAKLPERQRLAIALCHYQELSNIEAAAVMETTVEAVESLLGRARRTLRRSLAPVRDELMEGGGLK